MLTASCNVADVTVLSVGGRVDAATAPALDAEIERLVLGHRVRVVVDLTETEYMSSSGAAVLLYWCQRARRNLGDVRLAGPRPRVAMMLHLAAFDLVFAIFPGVEGALDSFTHGPSGTSAEELRTGAPAKPRPGC